ncbi:hypothetical protein DDZ18_08595 [Marinicauda salina]|uniref:Nitrate/nitrite sensing protein domain-containing protein n=1 Tax=Marinicauda salina TaxID=2135793 RepID=A0A2U2BUJ7_9PROT|nr:nitrate- and nitrite sensing domain-containing protein [Marinicauda salina]PWE17706.1 hypothetical protein DDZ18_08595 [Marinicauda salina]
MESTSNPNARARLRNGVIAAAAILAVSLAVWTFGAVNAERDRARRLEEAIELSAVASVLLHDLDRERSEAVYVTADPAAAKADFNARARNTDDAIATVVDGLAPAGGAKRLLGPQDPVAEHALSALERLDGLRAAVNARSLAPDETAARYTRVIDALIADQGAMLARLSPERPDIAHALIALARLADRVGLERGLGCLGFAVHGMPPMLETLLTSAHAEQALNRSRFVEHAPPERAAMLRATIARTETPEQARARTLLAASARGAELDASLHGAWSGSMRELSADLSVLKNVYLRESLEGLVIRHRARARARLILGGGATGGAVLLLLVAMAVFRKPKPGAGGASAASEGAA